MAKQPEQQVKPKPAFERTALDVVFHPRSVVFIGASNSATKLSGAPLRILKQHKFPGAVYCVNPKYREIDDTPCFPTVAALPDGIDLAFISLPAQFVPDAVDEIGRKGIKAIIILSSGFEEAGATDLALQLKQAAERHGVLVVGPNTEGIWSVRKNTILTFGSAAKRDHLVHGTTAVVSQSGAIGAGLVRQLLDGNWGISYFVSTGNEIVLTALDYVSWLIEQEDVRNILMFIEGFQDGRRLSEIASRTHALGKNLLVLKSGNSEAGQRATATHTGKISSKSGVYRDVLAQMGVIQVENMTDLLTAGQVLSALPLPKVPKSADSGLAVVSVPGGTRALIADQCEGFGLRLARFSPRTVDDLKKELPAFAIAENPVDLTAEVLRHPGMLAKALEIVGRDPNTESVIVQLGNGALRDIVDRRDIFADFAKLFGIPLIISFLSDDLPARQRCELAKQGIWCSRDCFEAVQAVKWLVSARDVADILAASKPTVAQSSVPSTWAQMTGVLAQFGVPVVRGHILDPGHSPLRLAFPVAVKALPEDAPHKTEQSLLRLNLNTMEEVETAAADIRRRLGDPTARVLVQEMAHAGHELLMTVTLDKDFGPLLVLATGGTDVELWNDAVNLSIPASDAATKRALDRLRTSRKFKGWRGRPSLDEEAVLKVARSLFSLAQAMPLNWSSVEINPLVVSHQGAVAVDVLVETRAV